MMNSRSFGDDVPAVCLLDDFIIFEQIFAFAWNAGEGKLVDFFP